MLLFIIGFACGFIVTAFALSLCRSAKEQDLEHYHDSTVGLYATDQWQRITDDDIKRLQLFRLKPIA